MISCQSQSDAEIRQIVTLVAQICFTDEFQALKNELTKVYANDGYENSEIQAFEDALYAVMMQYEEQNPRLKDFIASL